MRVFAARWVLPIVAPPIADGAVAVDADGRIAWVGPREAAPEGALRDLGDVALLPGLVNAHTHLELTAMRGFLEDGDFFAWIRTLTTARAEVLDDAALLDSARLGVVEGLAAGVTTFADTGSTDAPFRALRELGARGIAFQEIFGPHAAQHDTALTGLRERIAALRPLETPLVRLGVSPHAVYSVHEDLVVAASAFAAAEGLPVAMHVSESADEIAYVREGEGAFAAFNRSRGIPVARRAHSPVHLLAELGVAAVARPLLIHGTRFDESDVALAAHYDCPVAHCPASNAKLGHGVAPLVTMLEAGVRVGLGTDSVASNNRLDLLDEARLAVLLQRARLGRGDALDARAALELATLGGARALGLEQRVGALVPGADADLAAFPLDDARGAAHDPEATLVFAVAGRAARFVAVRGRVLVDDGRVLVGDPGLHERVRGVSQALAAWRADRAGSSFTVDRPFTRSHA